MPRLTTSQGTRLLTVSSTEFGEAFVADTGEGFHILVGFVVENFHDVVHGDDADKSLVLVDHGDRKEVVALELAGDLFLVLRGKNHVAVGFHQRFNEHVPLRPHQPGKFDAAHDAERRVDDEDLREALGQIVGVAHVVDDLSDRPERGDRHEVGLHQAPGGLFGIFEVAFERGAIGRPELGEDLFLVALLEALDDVGRVVGVEFPHRAGEKVVGQRLRQLVAYGLVEFGKDFEVEIETEREDQFEASLRLQKLNEIREVRGTQVFHHVTGRTGSARVQRCRDIAHQIINRCFLDLRRRRVRTGLRHAGIFLASSSAGGLAANGTNSVGQLAYVRRIAYRGAGKAHRKYRLGCTGRSSAANVPRVGLRRRERACAPTAWGSLRG